MNFRNQWTTVGCQLWMHCNAPEEAKKIAVSFSHDGFAAKVVNALCFRVSAENSAKLDYLPEMEYVEPTAEFITQLIFSDNWNI
jgi:hypothetical protein